MKENHLNSFTLTAHNCPPQSHDWDVSHDGLFQVTAGKRKWVRRIEGAQWVSELETGLCLEGRAQNKDQTEDLALIDSYITADPRV